MFHATKELEVMHPAAKLIVMAAKSQAGESCKYRVYFIVYYMVSAFEWL